MEQEDQPVVFSLEKFLPFFDKLNINVVGVWLCDNRVIFIEISYKLEPCHLFIYIPSKFCFTAEGFFPFPKYRLIMDDEVASLPSDTASIQVKQFLTNQIQNVKTTGIKCLYIGFRHIMFISRYNEIDGYNLEMPRTEGSFHYVTDWEWFFTSGKKEAPGICNKLDKLILFSVYDMPFVKDLQKTIPVIQEMTRKLDKWDSKAQLVTNLERIKKLDMMQDRAKTPQQKQEVVTVRNALRNKNLTSLCFLSSMGDLCDQLKTTLEKL
jgi:hypothetical protein